MALSKKPVTGMKDILPQEMQIRDYAIGVIKETYGKFGFTSIETPCVEHIANLTSRQGGDNEKLIFKILKRGEKLNVAQAPSCPPPLRPCRWGMCGGRTAPRGDVTVSSCSAISIFWGSPPIWRRLS